MNNIHKTFQHPWQALINRLPYFLRGVNENIFPLAFQCTTLQKQCIHYAPWYRCAGLFTWTFVTGSKLKVHIPVSKQFGFQALSEIRSQSSVFRHILKKCVLKLNFGFRFQTYIGVWNPNSQMFGFQTFTVRTDIFEKHFQFFKFQV